jgi:hypothetical protein
MEAVHQFIYVAISGGAAGVKAETIPAIAAQLKAQTSTTKCTISAVCNPTDHSTPQGSVAAALAAS